jgi:FKBP-type peptidyl-prolyl cis-trans isomerase
MRTRRAVLALTLAVALFAACAAEVTDASEPTLTTDEEKTLYALGMMISRNLATFTLTESELAVVQAGLADGVLGREAKVDVQTYGPKVNELAQARAAAGAEVEKRAAADFLDGAAKEPGATKSDSGLIYREITPGSGESPGASDQVKVHYHGTLRDGKVFDSSVDRGEPVTFALNRVIPCWTEGVQKMKVGGKSRLVCPSSIAYGERGAPPHIKPGAALSFEVELIEIVKAPAAAAPMP